MLRLHLLRHGQTEYSREDRFCGSIDAPLDAVGRAQAHAFALSHAETRWTAIVTSTRRRTQQTAAPAAAVAGVYPRIDARLDEISYGEWQGLSKTELLLRSPSELHRWLQDPSDGAPGGERLADVAARIISALNDMARAYPDGDVLLVSHKTALRVLICTLLGAPVSRYRELIPQPAAALTVFDWESGGPVLRTLASTAHLGGPENGPVEKDNPRPDLASATMSA